MQNSIKLLSSFIIVLFIASFNLYHSEAQDGLIEIPSLDIHSEIVPLYIREFSYGTTWDTRPLVNTVGYLTGTSWFGSNGNIVLGGHSELAQRQPDVFYNLDDIEVGAMIHINANNTTYNYVVASLEWVVPSDLNSVMPTGHDQLTIITCDTNSFDGNTYNKRLVVRALPA